MSNMTDAELAEIIGQHLSVDVRPPLAEICRLRAIEKAAKQVHDWRMIQAKSDVGNTGQSWVDKLSPAEFDLHISLIGSIKGPKEAT